MKIRLLPEIDLARIAVMSDDQALAALKQMKNGWAPYSYAPTRQTLPDILNVEPGVLGRSGSTDWLVIEDIIKKVSRSEEEKKANLTVSEALYKFSIKNEIRGRQHDFFPLALGTAAKVSYWSKAILTFDERPLVVFLDPRRSKSLSQRGRKFVFSIMHERIRALDADFAEVRLGIFQFGDGEEGSRITRLFIDESSDLFSFDQIDAMVRKTYEMWFKVLDEREADIRKKGTGTRGPLI